MLSPDAAHTKDTLARQLGDDRGRKAALASYCGVTPQAVNGWLRTGRVTKSNLAKAAAFLNIPLEELIAPLSSSAAETGTATLTKALSDWRLHASTRSQAVIDQLTMLAQKNALRDEDWELIEQMAARFLKR